VPPGVVSREDVVVHMLIVVLPFMMLAALLTVFS
jgi:hypothetical protein